MRKVSSEPVVKSLAGAPPPTPQAPLEEDARELVALMDALDAAGHEALELIEPPPSWGERLTLSADLALKAAATFALLGGGVLLWLIVFKLFVFTRGY